MIRNATLRDAKAITDIYNFYIKNHIATLEETPVDANFFSQKIKNATALFPWFVYQEKEEIIGFANASPWKTRSGYKYSAQLMVYLNPKQVAKGIGSLLYSTVINHLKEKGIYVIIGGISLPNKASVKLHEKFGFKKVAHYKEIGYKFNTWIDVGYWQLTIKNNKK